MGNFGRSNFSGVEAHISETSLFISCSGPATGFVNDIHPNSELPALRTLWL